MRPGPDWGNVIPIGVNKVRESSVCVCPVPKLAGGCGIDGHRHVIGECRICHKLWQGNNGMEMNG
jgi:hypothetical protein